MSAINDGGPAFARSGFYDADGKSEHDTLPEDGMTLRDWFAGQALVGMMQAMRPYSNDFARSAREAYVQADAMIAAREVKSALLEASRAAIAKATGGDA